jgi:phospholipase C
VPALDQVVLHLANAGTERLDVTIADAYLSGDVAISLRPGRSTTRQWSLTRTRGWYDLRVTVSGDDAFDWPYAGHVENGEASITDR